MGKGVGVWVTAMEEEYLNDHMAAIRAAIELLDEMSQGIEVADIRALLVSALEGFESEGYH